MTQSHLQERIHSKNLDSPNNKLISLLIRFPIYVLVVVLRKGIKISSNLKGYHQLGNIR